MKLFDRLFKRNKPLEFDKLMDCEDRMIPCECTGFSYQEDNPDCVECGILRKTGYLDTTEEQPK